MTNNVQLQGIGTFPGVPAGTLKKGDIIVWNFGYKSEVLEVLKVTKAQIKLLMKSLDSDYVGERILGKNRLIVKEEV